MSDEQFRLTPLDVRRWEFGTALRGYDRARVDEFKARVADEIEELARRINDLDTKARGFHDQIRSFRERDRAINDALVSAQQLRTDIREQAEKEGLDRIFLDAGFEWREPGCSMCLGMNEDRLGPMLMSPVPLNGT